MIDISYADYAWEQAAALLAIEILAVTDDGLAKKLADKRAADQAKVLAASAEAEAKYNC